MMEAARHIANFTAEEFNSQNREILDYNSLSYYVKHSENKTPNKFMIVVISSPCDIHYNYGVLT
jgi:hypothetical protein